MKLIKTIDVPIEKVGKNYIVGSIWALTLMMGSSSVSGNLAFYKVTKSGTNYVVPISVVKERVKILEVRCNDLDTKISIIKQIIGVEK